MGMVGSLLSFAVVALVGFLLALVLMVGECVQEGREKPTGAL